MNAISNNLSDAVASRSLRIMSYVILSLLVACTDPQEAAQPEASIDAHPESVPVDAAESSPEPQEEEPSESLP